jgi:hypothetical protein
MWRSKRQDWFLGLIVAFGMSGLPLNAQRHGRPDSAQNYAKSIPEPTLKIVVDGHTTNVRRKDLAAAASTVSTDVKGYKPGSVRSFTGVALAQLLPITTTSGVNDAYEIDYGFFHRQRIRATDLESESDLLIADEVNHRPVDRASLFHVTGRLRNGQPILIDKVTSIVLRSKER